MFEDDTNDNDDFMFENETDTNPLVVENAKLKNMIVEFKQTIETLNTHNAPIK